MGVMEKAMIAMVCLKVIVLGSIVVWLVARAIVTH